MDIFERVGVVEELFLVEVVVILGFKLVLVLSPEGDHAVEGLILDNGLVSVVGIIILLGVSLSLSLFHVHLDGEADIVGVFLYKLLDGGGFKILVIALGFGVVLEGQANFCTNAVLVALFNGVAVSAAGLPHISLVGTVSLGTDLNFLCYHESGVEAYAELTDDINIVCLFVLVLELEGAAVCDDTKVVFQLIGGHTDTVIGDSEHLVFLVGGYLNLEIVLVHANLVISKRLEIQLVDSIAGVGDKLTEEYFLVSINGVDHHIKQTLGFCFELFCFSHNNTSFYVNVLFPNGSSGF